MQTIYNVPKNKKPIDSQPIDCMAIIYLFFNLAIELTYVLKRTDVN